MQELVFNDHQFKIIERDGKAWLTAADIAAALGYARSDKATQIYDRHKIEFSDSMTAVVENLSLGHANLSTEVRVFSLRGAHLIGMFARTAKGVEFRKWVLDLLDALEQQAIPQRSMMLAWFEAKSELDGQNKFASLCGKGLSDHQRLKPPLVNRLMQISEKIQPSLSFN